MRSGRQVDFVQIGSGIGVAVLGLAVAAVLAQRHRLPRGPGVALRDRVADSSATLVAGRRLNSAAGMLAFSVLADSAIEHYRGSFKNKAMYVPLAVSSLALAVSMHGLGDPRQWRHPIRHLTYWATAFTGVVGTLFHGYNVGTRPGGFNWQNLFYGAPLGAPAAILLSGVLGAVAEQLRHTRPGTKPRVLGIPTGRLMAGVTAAGLLGTMGEAALLHFRGAYHNPFMFLPITLPPVGAMLLAEAAVGPRTRDRSFARWCLRLLAAMGIGGAGFHAYGVGRNMAGWRNWKQNLLNGPPLPAPPSFTGLALAGLAAIRLLERRPDA